MTMETSPVADIEGARVLARLGDSVTTDHISPAGSIKADSPAGTYLAEHGVDRKDFNSYGSRRGNHEVMIRGTFANIRLRNLLARRRRGRVHPQLPRRRRADDDLRRVGRLPGGGRPARHPRRQGVRLGLVARLGGQGHPAARRQGGHRRELRADPPLQPHRHGRPAAAVPRGGERRARSASTAPRPSPSAASRPSTRARRRRRSRSPPRRTAARACSSTRSSASTPRGRPTTTATTGSSSTSCGRSSTPDPPDRTRETRRPAAFGAAGRRVSCVRCATAPHVREFSRNDTLT